MDWNVPRLDEHGVDDVEDLRVRRVIVGKLSKLLVAGGDYRNVEHGGKCFESFTDTHTFVVFTLEPQIEPIYEAHQYCGSNECATPISGV